MTAPLPEQTPFDIARAEEAEDRKRELGVLIPFDRLPPLTFFGAPPATSPYWTRRAVAMRAEMIDRIGADRVRDAAELLGCVNRRFGPDQNGHAGVFEHNCITLAAALRCAEAGFLVIDSHALYLDGSPSDARKEGKTPRGSKWQLRATSDRAEIIKMWIGEGQYPPNKKGQVFDCAPVYAPRNLSLVTGGSTMVVDLDGAGGQAWLDEHDLSLPDTVEQITGSGGRHLLYRLPDGVEVFNSTSAIATGVDIRGEAGQIMAGPSIHKTANLYRWEDGAAPWECEVAPVPEWLLEVAQKASKKSSSKRRTLSEKVITAGRAAVYGDGPKGFEEWLAVIGDHPGGRGFHGPLFSASISWFLREGIDADAGELFDLLRARIKEAERDPARDRSRYDDDDDYVMERIEDGRDYAEAIDSVDDDDDDDDEDDTVETSAVLGVPPEHDMDDDGELIEFNGWSAGPIDKAPNRKAMVEAAQERRTKDKTAAGNERPETDRGSTATRRHFRDPLFPTKMVENGFVKGEGEKLNRRVKKVRTSMRSAMSEMFDFVILDGGDARAVMRPPPGEPVQFLKLEGFKNAFANRSVAYDTGTKKPGILHPATLFISDPDRPTYIGTQFEPDARRAAPDRLNMWTGFKVDGQTVPEGASWSLLRDHIRDQMVSGNGENADEDERLFTWFMTWLAEMFQRPGQKSGSAVALLGGQGVGKSKLADWLREAIGAAAVKIASRKKLVGDFNAHLDAKILAVAEEAFWSGDKQAAGVLKDLVTGDVFTMEKKRVDGLERPNHLRFIFTSNEKWVVPTDDNADSRRFFVLRVNDNKKQDAAFFAAIDRQMRDGGLEAMVAELMAWDPVQHGLTWSDLRNPPMTAAKREQATFGASGPRARLLSIIDGGVIVGRAKDGTPFNYDLSDDEATAVLREHLVGVLTDGRDAHGGAGKAVADAITQLLGDDADQGESKKVVHWELPPDADGDERWTKKKGRWVQFPPLSEVRKVVERTYG